MRYASLKARGTAPASSANKALVNQCMKRADMRWSVAGGRNVLAFGSLLMSGRFDATRRAMTGTCRANDSLNAVAA